MNIIITGATGRMGKILCTLLENGYNGHKLAAMVSPSAPAGGSENCYTFISDFEGEADCVIDFSNHAATEDLLAYCKEHSLPVVIATTGHSEEELALIENAAKDIPVFLSANMSVGVALLCELAKQAVRAFPNGDIEIVEIHHTGKVDVPSGTALMIANGIKEVLPDHVNNVGRHQNGRRDPKEIGIHSLRLGNEIGTHEVIISAGSQTITLKHDAENRALFAEGAITAAEFIKDKDPGLYNMKNLI